MTSSDKIEILLLTVICAAVIGTLAWGFTAKKPSDVIEKVERVEHEVIELRGEVQALKSIIAGEIP